MKPGIIYLNKRSCLCTALTAVFVLFSLSSFAEEPQVFRSDNSGLLLADLSELEGTYGHGTSGLDDLEGDHGHGPSGLDALEGTHGHDEMAVQDDGVICPEDSVCLEAETQLPLRLLPRPFSHVYSEPAADSDNIVIANIPAFHPLFVFERRDIDMSDPASPGGWYRVGQSRDDHQGWMQAADVMEWRQALLVSYTHPGGQIEGRNPVLMFRDLDSLKELVDDFGRQDRAREIYQGIETGDVPGEIVSMEPQRFVDITKQFYILPILDWEETSIMGDDVRLLQLAAAVPEQRGADTLDDEEYSSQARIQRGDQAGAAMEDLNVDIVFTIDTTRSMQPFIDMTREAVVKMVQDFTDDTAARFRFGLVGFRDCIDTVPWLEYDVLNFTPELVDGDRLIHLLEHELEETEVGSGDYAEEGFAGVDEALRSDWRDNSLRFMVFITDASSNPKGDPQNTTGKDEHDLRREADDAQVHILAIHLLDPRATEDHPIATPQYMKLSQVRGSSESAYTSVDAFEQEEYQALVDDIVMEINDLLQKALGTDDDAAAATAQVQDEPQEVGQGQEAVGKLWEAALVEYIGQSASPPKDIVAWAMDRDLVYTADRSLEVRVLVNRDQLSSLAQALDNVIQALMRAEVTQMQFFEALQSVSSQTMQSPEDISGAGRLADTGLLPSFIQALPYKSDILSLNDEMFASMTAEQRSQLEWNILAKLEQYRAINEQVDVWFRLNETDPDREMVYPLHLDYLP